ncbi:hypothetical protein Dimus_020656, partial [Dionaea muscipula]
MVGRRGYSQWRITGHFPGVGSGAPSPTAAHFRRGPPSPGRDISHRRSLSPMISSSPDMDDLSSTEEGEDTAADVTASEGEVGLHEGSISAASSDSSIPSPTTAVLMCQEAIAASGLEGGWSRLTRSESGCSISSPALEMGDGTDGSLVVKTNRTMEDLDDSDGWLVVEINLTVIIAIVDGTVMHSSLSTDEVLPISDTVGSSPVPDVPLFGGDLNSKAADGSDLRLLQNGDGGLVREEARVSSLVREALRSQPTDGLRKPPSTPVVPVSGAESGDGKN